MKQKLIGLSQRYVTALRKHLTQGPHAGLHLALGLGRRAVFLGVETLELARIHERALSSLKPSGGLNRLTKQAGRFFAEALGPITETHHTARRGKSDLNRLNDKLVLRTAELATTNRQLKRGVARCKRAEAALRISVKSRARLLRDSLLQPKDLRGLTHNLLQTQEKERQAISLQLQNEIAQTLLGINVRLLTLKTAANGNSASLTRELADTQRLVAESIQSINRFAHELSLHLKA